MESALALLIQLGVVPEAVAGSAVPRTVPAVEPLVVWALLRCALCSIASSASLAMSAFCRRSLSYSYPVIARASTGTLLMVFF